MHSPAIPARTDSLSHEWLNTFLAALPLFHKEFSMAIATFACAVVVIGCFVGPVLLLRTSATVKQLPQNWKLSRGWPAIYRDMKPVKIITWRDKDDPNSFMLQMEGKDPKILNGLQHKQLVQWMREGLTPEECYARLD